MPYSFISSILSHPVITDEEVSRIREELHRDGQLNLDDVKLLVELYCGASKYPPQFRELLFATLEEVLLADGGVAPSEQYYLLKMICGPREIGKEERKFLARLRKQLPGEATELDAMLAAVL